MPAAPPQSTKILIVEDNRIDAELTCHALNEVEGWPSTVNVVEDGDKAIQFLRRENAYCEALKPDLIILDMNLPKRDGTEVLQFIRSERALKEILVFIFSSSPVDIARESTDNANVKADRYFEKPYEVGTYLSIAGEIKDNYLSATRARHASA